MEENACRAHASSMRVQQVVAAFQHTLHFQLINMAARSAHRRCPGPPVQESCTSCERLVHDSGNHLRKIAHGAVSDKVSGIATESTGGKSMSVLISWLRASLMLNQHAI